MTIYCVVHVLRVLHFLEDANLQFLPQVSDMVICEAKREHWDGLLNCDHAEVWGGPNEVDDPTLRETIN